jgi:DNA repair exonuclease SbcCD ATPase subunit/DNA repair exonuclease SbcCD nuclease subunit
MIKSIAHIADLHIRLYKRHEEYRQVLDTLCTDLQAWYTRVNKQGMIVLAGDIVHSKTDMSPEMVALTTEYLKKISDIAPTILIAGNHDLNLSNPHRLDALTPIVDSINSKTLYYLRDSGVTTFDNVDFAVFSIIGDAASWPDVPKSSNVKVALYHGPLINAKTDVGYTITNHALDIKRFAGFDIVMLGDIHKYQVLQSSTPVILYPGSLIQQNHGETLENHGWIEWDLSTMAHTHHPVKNNYGYVTLEIDSSKKFSTQGIPENIRLRLLTENLDATEIKKIISLIRKKHVVLEYTVSKLIPKTTSTNTKVSAAVDVKEVSNQNKLIETYVKNTFPAATEDTVKKIVEINTRLNSNIIDDQLPKNITWKPLNLKFDNLFSYGKGNEIKFEDMTGIYGVFSPNATGKTSAFDALCFALYDKTPRAFKGNHIMNTREDACSCEFEFEVDGETYKINRTGSRKKNGEVKVDVDFYKKNGENWDNLTGEDRRDTNAIIRSYVGDYEDFILTTLSVQGQNSLFIDKGQSDRKDLLSQFMGLTIFDKLLNFAIEESKEMAHSLKKFANIDFTQKLNDLQTELESLEQQYDTLTGEVESDKQEIQQLSDTIQQLYETKVPHIKSMWNLDYDAAIEEFNKQISESVDLIDRLHKIVELTDKNIDEVQDKLNSYSSVSDLIEQNKQLVSYKTEHSQLQHKLKIMNLDLKNKNQKIDNLSKHEYDPNCKFCINNIFVKDAIQTAKDRDSLLREIEQTEFKIRALEDKIGTLQNVEDTYEQYTRLQSSLPNLITNKQNTELKIEKTINSMESIKSRLDKIEKAKAEFENDKTTIELNDQIDSAIKDIEKNKTELVNRLAKDEVILRNLHSKISVTLSEKNQIMQSMTEAKELEKTYEAYELYMEAVSRDGIPYSIISDIMPTIQDEVNNVLNQLVNFSIILDVDGKNVNGKIVYDDDRVWPLELASGMEKFISGLAIRVALMSVSNLPRSNFLVIDEGLGVLDSENLASMFMLFNMLKTKFEFIILISHLDTVRDIADTIIEIKRENEYSYITVK